MRYIYLCAADEKRLGFSHACARGREGDALVFRLKSVRAKNAAQTLRKKFERKEKRTMEKMKRFLSLALAIVMVLSNVLHGLPGWH